MSQESLENFGAYRLAMELFDLVDRCDAILGILSKTIVTLRGQRGERQGKRSPRPTSHAPQASSLG